MGVLGFAPFLQKRFPEVIRELPQRLRSLSGKTIAIDGTLITQRLHFAPIPWESRHILGWYRLVRELKASGVRVICVFDGAERNHAKQRETERRRKLQRMDVARGAMEIERSRRLRRLTTLLKQYRALPESVKGRTTRLLQDVFASHEQGENREPCREMAVSMDSDISPLANEPLASHPPPPAPIIDYRASPSRGVQKILNADQDPTEVLSHLDRSPKLQQAESGLQTLRDFLPEYFVTSEAAQTNEYQGLHEYPSKQQPANNVSSTQISHTQIFEPPQTTFYSSVSPSEGALEESHDDRNHIPELTEVHACDGNSALDVMISTEAPPFLPDNTLAAQDASSLTGDDDEYPADVNGFKSRADIPIGTMNSHLSVSLIDPEIVEAEPSPETISQGLLSLYHSYQESIPTFMSPTFLDPPAGMSDTSEVFSAQDQSMMSRNQVQLTLDEGQFWRSLKQPSVPALGDLESTVTDDTLDSLAQKSDIISRSYEKRNNLPTSKTYEECKLILRAMGVPCIDAVGPYEAEALAASLVHHGFADYVASEDTDVLVYEAPLLRNLTNRQGPLTLWSGAEVREVLQLDRASYVDFALLLGTDFSQRIKNLGPHRAIKLIRMHGRIEQVIANEPKFVPRVPTDAYLRQVEIARLVFETLPPVPDPETLQPMVSDDEAVVAILEKFGVYRAALVDWDFAGALDGNYFDDNPTME